MIIKSKPEGVFRENDWVKALQPDEHEADTFVMLIIPAEFFGLPVQTMYYEFHGFWNDEDTEEAREYISGFADLVISERKGAEEIQIRQVDETNHPESMN